MIEFHADDYGLFPEQSKRILACRSGGVLNGTSLMPNSEHLAECLEMLRPYADGMRLTVHLNLLEGASLCPAEELPLLVDAKGVFRVPFLTLLLAPLSRKRDEYRRELRSELRAQIRAVQPFLAELGAPLRLDGHAHWHMLPIVFDALMDVIREDELPVRYIRMPSEPLSLYLHHLVRIFPFHPINLVKTALLRILCRRNRRRYRKELAGLEHSLFMGVLFSGGFTLEKFRLLLPDAVRMAKRRGWDLELLAHPGAVYEPEDVRALTSRDDVVFLTSPAREKEAAALISLKEDDYAD